MMHLIIDDESMTELEKQLRAHLTIIDYFARKCLEGFAMPAEALQAIRETAAPYITPITDDQILVVKESSAVTREEPSKPEVVTTTMICPTTGHPCLTPKECDERPKCLKPRTSSQDP